MGLADFFGKAFGEAAGANPIGWGLKSAGGLAGLIGALTGPSAEEEASLRSRERGAADVSGYNRDVVSQRAFDPNAAYIQSIRAQKLADYLGNKDMQGQSAADRNPALDSIMKTLQNPENQNLFANESGGLDWRPPQFTPTTLDDKGMMKNAGAPQFSGNAAGYQAPPPVQQPLKVKRPEDF